MLFGSHGDVLSLIGCAYICSVGKKHILGIGELGGLVGVVGAEPQAARQARDVNLEGLLESWKRGPQTWQ